MCTQGTTGLMHELDSYTYVTAMIEIHASFSAYGLKVAETFLNFTILCYRESLDCPRTQSAKFSSKKLRP